MASRMKIKKRGDFRLRGKGRKWAIKRPRKKPAVFKQVTRRRATEVADPWDVLDFVLMTEKAVRAIENENVLSFVVKRTANKASIKLAFEAAFASKVKSVRTLIDQDGRKKAVIKLAEPGAASDIAIKLGII